MFFQYGISHKILSDNTTWEDKPRRDRSLRVDLDDIDLIEKLDPSQMLSAVGRFPAALSDSKIHFDRELVSHPDKFRNLVLMGMGGSASAADVTLDWLRNSLKIPSFLQREPSLPGFVNSNTLFVAISYSGETAETLAAFQAAKRRRSQLVGIGNGGKLAQICARYRAPFIQVTSAISPRAALPQLLAATARALDDLQLVRSTSPDIKQASRDLESLRDRLRVEVPMRNNLAKKLAEKFLGHFLVLYSLQRMSSVARRFKNQLAENSKEIAKYDTLPESCHNEVEAWQMPPSDVLAIIIRDSAESRFEKSIIRAFRSTIGSSSKNRAVDVRVASHGNLSRLLSPILLLDYVSVYLAFLRRLDPTPTQMIKKYKAEL